MYAKDTVQSWGYIPGLTTVTNTVQTLNAPNLIWSQNQVGLGLVST
jgi:hypothetical protein